MSFSYSPKIVTDGLVLYLDAANPRSYPGTGTVWSDLSRSGNNGTLTNFGSQTIFNSANGGSIIFDGTDDYALIPNLSVLNSTLITVSLWIKFGSSLSSDKVLFSKGSGFGIRSYWFYENTGVQFVYGAFSPQIPAVTLTNKWSNIVGVQTSTNSSIYLNGILFGFSNGVGSVTNNENIGINAYPNGSFFASNKNISSIHIYNRALSSTEVLQNYNATKTRFGL